jgi:hypothetical protein
MNNYTLILFRDGRSILCSDEEIKEGDYKYHHVTGVRKALVDGNYTNQFKIIAGIPKLPSISMSDEIRNKLFELYEWVDVDNLWEKQKYVDRHNGNSHSFKLGFNKNQELRGFSLRDMEKAFEAGFDRGVAFKRFDENPEEIPVSILNEYDFIKSLQEPIEVKVELEMEEYGVCKPCNNQGVYHCAHPEECGSAKILQRPKTTNNSYTINKILTLL